MNMINSEQEQLNKTKNELEKQSDLPKILKYYKTKDFAIQQRVKFVYYLSISLLSGLFLIIISSSYIQLTSIQYNGLYLPVILPEYARLSFAFCVCIFL